MDKKEVERKAFAILTATFLENCNYFINKPLDVEKLKEIKKLYQDKMNRLPDTKEYSFFVNMNENLKYTPNKRVMDFHCSDKNNTIFSIAILSFDKHMNLVLFKPPTSSSMDIIFSVSDGSTTVKYKQRGE